MIKTRCLKCGYTWGYEGSKFVLYNCPRCENVGVSTFEEVGPKHEKAKRNLKWLFPVSVILGLLIISVIVYYQFDNLKYAALFIVLAGGATVITIGYYTIFHKTRTEVVLKPDVPVYYTPPPKVQKHAVNNGRIPPHEIKRLKNDLKRVERKQTKEELEWL